MASELHVDAIKHSGGTSAMTIDSSGRPAFPNRVVFEAWYTGANLVFNSGSNAGLTYNNVEQQGGTNYSTSTGKFTVPITGFYLFAIKNNFYNIADNNIFYHGLMQNGTGFSTDEATLGEYMTSSHDTLDYTLSSTIIRKYTANDTLQPFVRVGDNGNGTGRTNAEALNYHTFAGFLIG
tara:strand:- start:744 stop:1280 length:537 start_codon:yes stop_codon:yes gene_type:complete